MTCCGRSTSSESAWAFLPLMILKGKGHAILASKNRFIAKRFFDLRRITSSLLLLCLFPALSCNRVRLGDARMHYVRGEYHAAVGMYRTLYRQTPREERALRGVIAFEMAENYRHLNQSAHAATAYGNAIRFGYPDPVALLRQAQMLHREGEYTQAAALYHDYLSHAPEDETAIAGLLGVEHSLQGLRQSEGCTARYQVSRMDLFNSSRSDFSPFLMPGDELLYFTSSRESIPGEERSPVTGTKYHDIFFSAKDSQEAWRQPKRVESPLNTHCDEGVATVTNDGGLMFYSFTPAGSGEERLTGIFFSRRVNGVWSSGNPLAIRSDDSLSLFAHPAISGSGELLFFVSDMPGGYGGTDIWLAHLNHRQEVVSLENAGAVINTHGNEMFPVLQNDTTLYFSSDGHPGRGGLDLFRAIKSSSSKRWRLEQLPVPLNSPADDFGITLEQGGGKGFFSSNRDDARGYDHIWSFVRVDRKIRLEGFVVDPGDHLIAAAVIDVVGSDGSLHRVATDREGVYHFVAEEGVDYLFLAQAEGYLNRKQSLPAMRVCNDTLIYLDFEMTPYNRPVILEHIFYDFDRAVLRPESEEELGNLITLMQEHPEIRVQLSSHTDRHGSDSYNHALSLRRASSVADFLVAGGVDPERLACVGYGSSTPKQVDRRTAAQYPFLQEGLFLTDSCIRQLSTTQQEIADQLNRRTEFLVMPPSLISP